MAGKAAFYYAGLVIVLALLLGGGTMQGLWTDRIIQFALIPALILGLGRMDDSRWSPAAKILAAASILLFIVQLSPIGRAWPSGDEPVATGIFLSAAASRTVEAMLVFVPVLAFALFVSRFADHQQERLLRFVIVGLIVNLGVGAFQLSASGSGVSIQGSILPYGLNAGAFVNRNHFSTMVVAVIPILAFFYLRRTSRPLIFIGLLGVILVYLFAVGSRAGIGMAIGVAVISALLLTRQPQLRRWRPALIALVGVVGVLASISQPDFQELGGAARGTIFSTTLHAIQDHWAIGTGIGSFENVYPFYENPANITGEYINHAHNEYLELWLEAGLVALFLIGGFMALVLLGARRTSLATTFTISILAIAVHCLVDYPTRTMAIGVLLAYFAAHVLSPADRPARRQPAA